MPVADRPPYRGFRSNPIRDASDRTHPYADDLAGEKGRQQPITIRFGKTMKLADAFGAELSTTAVDIIGRSALVEYRPSESSSR